MSRRWIFVALIALALVPRAHAQATQTFVSSLGDDANPCSRTAPCRTFVVALANTAMGGEVDALDSGDFGPINEDARGRPGIEKSITIDGGAGHAGIVFGSAAGVKINITNPADAAKHVILRNLQINGLGVGLKGVSILAANRVDLEGVFIQGAGAAAPGSSGIEINSSSPVAVNINHCTIANNAVSGIVSSGSSGATTDIGVRLTVKDSNIAGNGTGINLAQNSSLALYHSALTENVGRGLLVSSGCEANVDQSTFSFNGLAAVDNQGTTRLFASQVTFNNMAFRGAAIETHGNNAVFQNVGNSIGLPRTPVKVGLQ